MLLFGPTIFGNIRGKSRRITYCVGPILWKVCCTLPRQTALFITCRRRNYTPTDTHTHSLIPFNNRRQIVLANIWSPNWLVGESFVYWHIVKFWMLGVAKLMRDWMVGGFVSFKNEGSAAEGYFDTEWDETIFMHYLLIVMKVNRRGYKLIRVSVTKCGYEATRKTIKLVPWVRKMYFIIHRILLKFGIGCLH